MLRDPTIQDFADWVQFHLDKAIKNTHMAVQGVERKAAAAGAHRSGRTIIMSFEAAYEEFDKGVEAALGALKVALLKGQLDKALLRQTTEDQLRKFELDMKHASKAPLFRAWVPASVINEREAEFDKKIDFALRHFDVGHLDPQEPEVPETISSNIHIENMAGGAIGVQQRTTHSTQSVSAMINVEAARAALESAEDAINEASVPEDILAQLKPELDTIKAQLAKPKPSTAILIEAGQSLRTITEGIVGGLLAPHVVTALAALLSALGLT